MAIVHSHTPSALPFFVSRTPLRPGYHMSAFLAKTARCEISKDFVDATDMLISNAVMGRSPAKAMHCACVTLMRGHGLVAVGRSLQEAVYRAICTYVNARVRTQAMALDDMPASAGPTW
ncbi:class II aldolase/adducin family protein [Hyphomicrobiales bacterium BP6-180914]|uniref:Class II aldolase/adducin family protein n=1 Tax=Lichenifustis flavocetrariae TaxID=2949735 RepID=A0AA42CMD2_9HYPH|nr:class II aldolase/adducin family protein [Lichenifustis flavocetrariae]MCW6511446.1 class II aldolase/adducin family protein [Lichenifustis flavocetrariae]